MPVSFESPTPLTYFSALVQSDQHFPLLEAAASLAQDDTPQLDVQQVLDEVDQLLDGLRRRVPADAAPLARLRALNHYFFHDLGFGGNLNDYYDPQNSYLSAVLRTRRGIPISLAVLWLELAQGLGLQVGGLSFPGHFMLKVTLPMGQVVIDPFSGRSLSLEELGERLEPLRPSAVPEGGFELSLGHFLQAAAPREIIARMLRNLKEVHRSQEDWRRFIAVQDRLIVLLPHAWPEYRDRGLAHARCGYSSRAASDFETYLAHIEEEVPDAQLIAEQLAALRRARS